MKIGLIGAGHLGKIHLKCLKMIDQYELVGVYDVDIDLRTSIAETYTCRAFESVDALIDAVDIIDIVTPTSTHFEIAKKAIEQGKHVFIEKPVTQTLWQAEELLRLKNEYHVQVQVGHVERFNPAISSIDLTTLRPMFIEVHRLSAFNPRGTDVSVVLDLMIHDIDIILQLVDSPIASISANGVGVVSKTPDIANARIEFENGCVVNLTASRISLKQMRKMRIFQSDAYISLDFLEKKAQVVKLHDVAPESYISALETNEGTKYLQAEFPEIKPTNAIKQELETFLECIKQNSPPKVSLNDGYEALKLAHTISTEITKRLNNISGENKIH